MEQTTQKNLFLNPRPMQLDHAVFCSKQVVFPHIASFQLGQQLQFNFPQWHQQHDKTLAFSTQQLQVQHSPGHGLSFQLRSGICHQLYLGINTQGSVRVLRWKPHRRENWSSQLVFLSSCTNILHDSIAGRRKGDHVVQFDGKRIGLFLRGSVSDGRHDISQRRLRIGEMVPVAFRKLAALDWCWAWFLHQKHGITHGKRQGLH